MLCSTLYPLPFFSIIRLIILSAIFLIFEYDKSIKSVELLWFYIVFYICLLAGEFLHIKYHTNLIIKRKKKIVLSVLSINELCICIVSMRGSILETSKRSSMQYWLYLRLSKIYSPTNSLMSIYHSIILFPYSTNVI